MSGSFQTYLQIKQARMTRLQEQLHTILPHSCEITLEIGCGHGDYLNAYGAVFTNELCIGIDIISRRVFKSVNKLQRAELANVHFLKAEAQEFLSCLPSYVKLAKILILFPDPWPKKRHHKNRLIQPAFLDTLADLATQSAKIYFRTDHADYFTWTSEIIAAHPRWRFAEEDPWPLEAVTYFQKIMGPPVTDCLKYKVELT
ncbi:MAG: tRNA (guanosine(46)-N7)-methyltransferase TrmB [Verrucomicrobia bacterium]|nr:tRNA (guanosine(46)-N7)-methyltransferase TrmB [Verrucomicrobiota bacterium]